MPDNSKEELKIWEKNLANSDALLNRQEEIINKIIEGEIKIGDTRIAQLDKFFDRYSERLDTVVANKTSELGELYKILEGKLDEFIKNTEKKSQQVTLTHQNRQNAAREEFAATGESGSGNSKDRTAGNTVNDRSSVGEIDYSKRIDEIAKFFQKNTEEQQRSIASSEEAIASTRATSKSLISEMQSDFKEYASKLEKTLAENQAKSAALLQSHSDAQAEAQANELKLAALNITRLDKQQAAADAEAAAINNLIDINAEREYAMLNGGLEAAEAQIRTQYNKDLLDAQKEQAAAQAAYEDRLAREYRRKHNGEITKEALAEIKKEANDKFKYDKDTLDKLAKEREKQRDKEARMADAKARSQALDTLTSKESSFAEKREALKALTQDEAGNTDGGKIAAATVAALDKGVKALSSFAQQLNTQIDEIAYNKGFVDTRLQGSNMATHKGSYWDQISKDMMAVGAVNPYFKQEDFAKNIKSLIDTGIAFDLEQRAFLATISDKIANTFNVADASLLKLVRIQQEDSSAGRLGMESALNAFLNNMYENTEYLKGVADSVRSSLYEMEALMTGASATEVEFQVQKWMGSLYSVGMSDTAVNAIASAFGKISSGQIDGLTEGGTGSLLVMAANDAGLSIADILTDGIDSSETNMLLQSVVNYLADLYESSEDNKVVQQQLANVFGVKASDLKAATNLATSTSSIAGTSMTYDDMLGRLFTMAGSMGSRTSIGEMIANVIANGKYTLSGSIASSPVANIMYQFASILQDTTGGIAIPAISVMGNMVDLHTTVADLIRVASLGTGILGSMGSIVSGLSNSFSGQSMLQQLGIESGSGLAVTPRGDGSLALTTTTGVSVSDSGYVGNSSGSDVKDSTFQEAEDNKKQLMIEAKEEEENNQIDSINTTVLKIYELLDDVANGKSSLKVKVEGYGLTRAGSSGAGSAAMGGVAGLNSANGGNMSTSSGSFSSSGIGGNIDIGNWIMV